MPKIQKPQKSGFEKKKFKNFFSFFFFFFLRIKLFFCVFPLSGNKKDNMKRKFEKKNFTPKTAKIRFCQKPQKSGFEKKKFKNFFSFFFFFFLRIKLFFCVFPLSGNKKDNMKRKFEKKNFTPKTAKIRFCQKPQKSGFEKENSFLFLFSFFFLFFCHFLCAFPLSGNKKEHCKKDFLFLKQNLLIMFCQKTAKPSGFAKNHKFFFLFFFFFFATFFAFWK